MAEAGTTTVWLAYTDARGWTVYSEVDGLNEMTVPCTEASPAALNVTLAPAGSGPTCCLEVLAVCLAGALRTCFADGGGFVGGAFLLLLLDDPEPNCGCGEGLGCCGR